MSNLLIVMRLIEMRRQHPGQVNSKRCSKCGQSVGIYPSGQRALIEDPSLEIICNVCADVPGPARMNIPAALSFEEFIEELDFSVDVKKA